MGYANPFLKTHGTNVIIQRTPTKLSKVSMKRSTNSTSYLGAREAYYSGIILPDSDLKAGEVFSIGMDKYLVQTALKSFGDGVIEFMAAKVNAILSVKRYGEFVDNHGNIIQGWDDVSDDVPSFGEIVTYQTRQADPGILEGTRYIFQVPKQSGVLLKDRIIYKEKKYDVISVDNVLDGIDRLQLALDTRAD